MDTCRCFIESISPSPKRKERWGMNSSQYVLSLLMCFKQLKNKEALRSRESNKQKFRWLQWHELNMEGDLKDHLPKPLYSCWFKEKHVPSHVHVTLSQFFFCFFSWDDIVAASPQPNQPSQSFIELDHPTSTTTSSHLWHSLRKTNLGEQTSQRTNEKLCWIGIVLVYILRFLLLLPTSLDAVAETWRSRRGRERAGPPTFPRGVHLSVTSNISWAPPPSNAQRPRPPLLSVMERKTDTCMHCFQCPNFWTWFIWNWWVSKF